MMKANVKKEEDSCQENRKKKKKNEKKVKHVSEIKVSFLTTPKIKIIMDQV